MRNRILSFAIALMMLSSIFPVGAAHAEEAVSIVEADGDAEVPAPVDEPEPAAPGIAP